MPADRAGRQRYYERHFRVVAVPGIREKSARIVVPDDVQRIVGDGSPCFMCESPGPCRHRSWVLRP